MSGNTVSQAVDVNTPGGSQLLGATTQPSASGPNLAASSPSAPPRPLPQPKEVTLDPRTTALLVLDLNARCSDPRQICNKLVPVVKPFLERAREAGIPVIYTVSASAKGTPLGEIWEGFSRRADEPVIYPDAFDKFVGGELQQLLRERGIKTVIVTGSSTNFAVLYTATTAARMFNYNVVIPVDGSNAASAYEHEYTLFQFTVLPNVAKNFSFTTMDMVAFAD